MSLIASHRPGRTPGVYREAHDKSHAMSRREYNVQMTDTFNNWSSRKSRILRAKSESQGAESDSKSESPTDESESSPSHQSLESESSPSP